MVRNMITKLAGDFKARWQRDRAEIMAALIGFGILLALSTAVDVAYTRFGMISLTQFFYFYLGFFSFCFCMVIFLSRRKGWLLFYVLLFSLNDIVPRLVLSFIERTPGTFLLEINFLQAASSLGVRLLFLLPVLGVYFLRSRFRPLHYWLTAYCFGAAAFCLSAVLAPHIMCENLYSHGVHYVEPPAFRVFAIDDDATFLLDSFSNAEETLPRQARIVRHDGHALVLDGWDICENIIGFTRQQNDPGFQAVLALFSKESETVRARLVHYMDGRIVQENSHEFPYHLVPHLEMNSLSPGGAFVALNNGVLLDFMDPETVYHVFEESPDVTHRFIEWTDAPEEYALYYYEPKNQVILVDPRTREQVAVHSLTFREPVVNSLALSPNGQRLLYAGRLTDCFFLENFGTKEVEYHKVHWSDAYTSHLRPFWINDAQFMYVSHNRHLNRIDDTGVARISQVLSQVWWAYYEPVTRRVIWTSMPQGKGALIHAMEVDP